MFNIDAKIRARIAPHIERVLIVDPNLGATRVLIDLLKDLGARQRLHAPTTRKALELSAEWAPQLIFVEFAGPGLDGVEFTTQLRRSALSARTAPVIVITADTRAASIIAARDAGAHEFLCKPFTAGHVFRRVENVTLKPRPWIEAKMYVGPDRRRFNSGEFEGARKRRADSAMPTGVVMALTAIRAQLDCIKIDPQAALGVMMEQAAVLQASAAKRVDTDRSRAIGALLDYLTGLADPRHLDRDAVEQRLAAIQGSTEQSRPAPARGPAVMAG